MSVVSVVLRPLAYLSLPIFMLHQLAALDPRLRYYIRLALYVSTISICSAWGVIVSIAMSLVGRRFDINYVVARSFLFLAGRAMGISFQVEGEEHLNTTRPAIVLGNHQSMLDVLFLGRIFPKQASILAKKELKYTPILGQFMLLSGAIFIDRGNNKEALLSLASAGNTMRQRKTSIWVFPEGTRTNSKDLTLLPFKKGAFHMAVQSGVPIVPVVCENYWHLYHKGVFEGGTLRIRVLPPVSTTGKTAADVAELAESVREQMIEALRDISHQEEASEIDPSAEKPTGPEPMDVDVEERQEEQAKDASEGRQADMSDAEDDEELVLVGRPGES